MAVVDLLNEVADQTGHTNRHGNTWAVVAGTLCAGLYPNVVRIDSAKAAAAKAKKTSFYTQEHGKIDPHPSSVNGGNTEVDVNENHPSLIVRVMLFAFKGNLQLVPIVQCS